MPPAPVLRRIIDSFSQRVLLVDAAGTIILANESLFDSLDYTRREILGDNIQNHGSRFPRETDGEVNLAQNPIRTEIKTAEGVTKSLTWEQTITEAGETYYLGRVIDSISTPNAIFKNTIAPYRALVQHFPNGLVALFDSDYRYHTVGGVLFDDLDISPDQLEGQRLGDVFPAETVAELQPAYEAALNGETRTLSVSVGSRTFWVHVIPIRTAAGEVAAGMTVSQDITEQQERERELEEARARYNTLIEDAPIPIFVANTTGTLVEVNAAAEALLGCSRHDLLGEPVTTLYPPDEEDAYAKFFELDHANNGTYRYRPDGEQNYVVTDDGTQIPVEINVTTVTVGADSLVVGIFRDISEQVRYETVLEELHEKAHTLLNAETDAEIAEDLVHTATEILDLDLVSVNLYDEAAAELNPVAYSDDVRTIIGTPPSLPIEGSVAGTVFVENEPFYTDDVREEADVYDPTTRVRSQLIVPINGYGVIISGSTERDAFDTFDQRLLDLLGRHAEAVFDRTAREQELRKRERELTARTDALEDVEALNTQLQGVIRVAASAETQTELAEEVCRVIVQTDRFSFAWLGRPTENETNIEPVAWAGDEQGYLDRFPSDGEEETDPAVQTTRTGDVTVVSNIARDVQTHAWRREAMRRGYRAAISIPVTYQGTLYAVLTVFADTRDAFSNRLEETFLEWGSLLGCMLNKIERTNAILAEYETRATYRLTTSECPLIRAAQDCSCTITFRGLQNHSEAANAVFVTVAEESGDQFVAVAERSREISEVTRVRTVGSRVLFRILIIEPFIATVLARYGIRLRQIEGVDANTVRTDVLLPTTLPLQRASALITREYPSAELLSTERVQTGISISNHLVDDLLTMLSDREREALELAYHGGYFETPKGMSGSEIADQMDLSSSSFHNYLHAAQRTMFRTLFE